MGAVIVCFDIWWFKQVNNSKTGFWWAPLWFWATRAVFDCACVHKLRKVRIRGTRRFYFVRALLIRGNVQTHLGGASIREGASNRDITVIFIQENVPVALTQQHGSHYLSSLKSMVSCQKGPSRHAYAWQIGTFWQDTLKIVKDNLYHTHGSRKLLSAYWVMLTCFSEPGPSLIWMMAPCQMNHYL